MDKEKKKIMATSYEKKQKKKIVQSGGKISVSNSSFGNVDLNICIKPRVSKELWKLKTAKWSITW